MTNKKIELNFKCFENIKELELWQQELVIEAIAAAEKAYAPYSNFPVGAAILTENGEIFKGNNQENVSFPAGICAERTVLHYFKANYPSSKIKAIAITASNAKSEQPISPCGICRQVMTETEREQKSNLLVILHKINGETYVFESAKSLLPLAFDEELKK